MSLRRTKTQFVNNLSSVVAPLNELLKQNVPWKWAKQQESAFNQSKELLQSSQVLVHYNPKLPLVLCVDASPYGIGDVLSHFMPYNTDKPIAFASRKLTPAEMKKWFQR